MGITIIFCVLLLILPGERVLIRGQTAIGGGNGSDCCPFVAVNEGTIAGLDGSYSLKENQGSKPEDVCINGCVYTKDGTPASDEYCFRQDDVKRANVMCPADISPYGITQPSTTGPTTPAETQGTTTAAVNEPSCGQGDVTVVSGDVYSPMWPLESMLTHDQVEKKENEKYNYWITPGPGNFILNLGCTQTFTAIKLVNTRDFGDSSTRKFRLFTSLTQSGPWTQVLETELEDSRQQQDPLPLQLIALDRTTTAQYVRFQMRSWWGDWGGGFMYFDIQRN